jgi:hypothetical protein
MKKRCCRWYNESVKRAVYRRIMNPMQEKTKKTGILHQNALLFIMSILDSTMMCLEYQG